jgi:predicted amidophosphoribosyltransferase
MDMLEGWIGPLGGLAVVLMYALYVAWSRSQKPPSAKPAVVNCPDCGGKVSSKINACPHCGRPMNG